MSYALYFYQGTLAAVEAGFGAADDASFALILPHWKKLYAPDPGENAEATLRAAIKTIHDSLGRTASSPGPIEVETTLVAALMAHSSQPRLSRSFHSSGEEFRKDFLAEVAAKAVGYPDLMESLTKRPLFGFRPTDYPAWGFVTKEELANLPPVQMSDPKTSDLNLSAWLKDFLPIFETARQSGQDLITVYQ